MSPSDLTKFEALIVTELPVASEFLLWLQSNPFLKLAIHKNCYNKYRKYLCIDCQKNQQWAWSCVNCLYTG